MRHARGRASQPRGPLEQWVGRVLPVALLTLAAFVLWAAALSTAWRCGHETSGSPDQVTVTACPSPVTER